MKRTKAKSAMKILAGAMAVVSLVIIIAYSVELSGLRSDDTDPCRGLETADTKAVCVISYVGITRTRESVYHSVILSSLALLMVSLMILAIGRNSKG